QPPKSLRAVDILDCAQPIRKPLRSTMLHSFADRNGPSCVPADDIVAQDEDIHVGAQEAVQRLYWSADHRFVFIEGGVEHYRHTCDLAKRLNQLPIPRTCLPVDRLQAS